MVFLDVQDSYDQLTEKLLLYLEKISQESFDYFMHVDDDSFVRADLLLPELQKLSRSNVYWGYLWNSGSRNTKPIRDPTAKSYMPKEHWPDDDKAYPPFQSGCGFVLSADLVQYLVKNKSSFKPCRLIDVAVGIYLEPKQKDIQYINEERIRPYPGIPLFNKTTIVQHYMK